MIKADQSDSRVSKIFHKRLLDRKHQAVKSGAFVFYEDKREYSSCITQETISTEKFCDTSIFCGQYIHQFGIEPYEFFSDFGLGEKAESFQLCQVFLGCIHTLDLI